MRNYPNKCSFKDYCCYCGAFEGSYLFFLCHIINEGNSNCGILRERALEIVSDYLFYHNHHHSMPFATSTYYQCCNLLCIGFKLCVLIEFVMLHFPKAPPKNYSS